MININLARSRTPPRRSIRRAAFLLACLIASGIFLIWYIHLLNQIERGTAIESSLRQEAGDLDQLRNEIALNRERAVEIGKRTAWLNQLLKDREQPLLVLKSVAASLSTSGRLSLTSLTMQDLRLRLSGRALDVTAVADFVSRLSHCTLFETVELHKWKNSGNLLEFEIVCSLKDEAA